MIITYYLPSASRIFPGIISWASRYKFFHLYKSIPSTSKTFSAVRSYKGFHVVIPGFLPKFFCKYSKIWYTESRCSSLGEYKSWYKQLIFIKISIVSSSIEQLITTMSFWYLLVSSYPSYSVTSNYGLYMNYYVLCPSP